MYLGIDAGTSEMKAVIIDDEGHVIAESHYPLTVSRPHLQWSEQDPAEWWDATQQMITALRNTMGPKWKHIKAIGLSGQMHGAVLLDKNDQILRPCILWNDMRSAAECQALMTDHPEIVDITGNIIMPGFTAPKLVWVARHEPDIFARTAKIVLPKDYLRWKMSGEFITDMSDASGTMWLDVAKRDWSDACLSFCNLNRSHMPRLVEGSESAYHLSAHIAQEWGLRTDVIIAGGGGDNAASAVGVGITQPNDAFISLGTSGVIFVVNEKFSPNPSSAVHAFCHALPNRWHQMSVMLSAASCLRWLSHIMSVSEADLLAETAALGEKEWAQAPVFLPYFSGERTPHNDPLASGSFFGLHHKTQRGILAYSVLEGVAFGLAEGWQVLQEAGADAKEFSLIGGGSRSPIWAQLIADILDRPILTHKESAAGGAFGAARLGWLATGTDEATICTKPAIKHRFVPQKERYTHLQNRLELFRLLYQQQKSARALFML